MWKTVRMPLVGLQGSGQHGLGMMKRQGPHQASPLQTEGKAFGVYYSFYHMVFLYFLIHV